MGTSGQPTVIMKVFLILSAALLATASATTEVGCEDCKALVSTLGMYLSSAESISGQVEILLANVCPQAEDPEACVEGLPAFWEKIAMMLWPGYYNPEEEFMCMQEGLCGAPGSRDAMTCDECLDGIQATIDQLLSEEFITGAVALPTLAMAFEPETAMGVCNMAVADTCMA